MDLSKLSKSAKQRKAEEFVAEYKTLCEKHGIEFLPRIQVTENGIFPRIDVVERKTQGENIKLVV